MLLTLGGQFAPKKGGQFARNIQYTDIRTNNMFM